MRGVMQYSDLSWRASSLLGSVAVQAALSIYWGMLGVLGMVSGRAGTGVLSGLPAPD